MFETLARIAARPEPFSRYTTPELWNDPYISRRMLELHLDPDVDRASRRKAFVDRSADWIVGRFGLGPGKSVCDLGCGPGLYATRFAAAGAAVTGVDLSENSLAYARAAAARDGLAIDYVQANYLDFGSDRRFDLISLIFCDFCVLGPDQRAALLEAMRGLLADGGDVLLDVFSPACFAEIEEKPTFEVAADGGFWSAAPHFVFLNTFKYDDDRVFLHKYTVVEPDRVRDSYNWIQCYDPDGLGDLFAAHGLRVVETLGNVAGDAYDADAPEFAVIAEKAA